MIDCLKYLFYKNKIDNDCYCDYNYINSKKKLNENFDKKFVILNDEIFVECSICFEIEKLKDIKMLYPCGHRLCCNTCLNNIEICTICKKQIEKKIQIFEVI